MFAAIESARDHINLETYILDDDEVGQRFAQALIAKQQQGVQVNVIRDSVGTVGTPAAFFQRLSDSGINVLEFNPLNPLATRKEWELNQRDHRKLLIVDGQTAFMGGINISSVYSGGSFSQRSRIRPDGSPAWRDTDLQLKGPVVAEFQKLFLRPGPTSAAGRCRQKTTSLHRAARGGWWFARSEARRTRTSA
jgi:cardiolipin synthase